MVGATVNEQLLVFVGWIFSGRKGIHSVTPDSRDAGQGLENWCAWRR